MKPKTIVLLIIVFLAAAALLPADEDATSPAGPGIKVTGHKDVIALMFSGNETLSVQIVDAKTRKPIKDATVELGHRSYDWDHPCGFSAIAKTDKEGLSKFANLTPEWYILAFSAPGYSAVRVQTNVPTDGGKTLVAPLPPGVLFHGKVTDESGTPVTGAKITLVPLKAMRMQTAWMPFRSDENGKFELSTFPSRYCMWVEAKGYAPHVVKSLEIMKKTDAGTIKLKTGRIVTLTVKNALGKPVSGLAVYAQCREQWPFPRMVHATGGRTDKNGKYVFKELREGKEYFVLTFRQNRQAGYANIASEGKEAGMTLEEGYTISGRLLEKGTGEKITGKWNEVQVYASWSTPKGDKSKSAYANPDMTYKISLPTLKACKIRASSSRYLPMEKIAVPEPEKGKTGVTLDLVLDPGLFRKVQVVDEETGTPISGIEAMFSGTGYGRYKSDENGMYKITGLKPGKLSIRFISKKYDDSADHLFDITEGEASPIVIKLSRGGEIKGIVLGPGEQPVSGASILLSGEMSGPGFCHKKVRSGNDGSFTITGLPKMDSFKLQVGRKGLPSRLLKFEAFEKNEKRTGVVIRLVMGGACAAVVLDADGKPVAEACVSLERITPEGKRVSADERETVPIGEFCSPPKTNAFGKALLRDIKPGNYVVTALKQGYEKLEKEITITAGKATQVVLKFAPVEFFSGKVVDEDGKPVINVSIRVDSMPDAPKRYNCDSYNKRDGTFRIVGVQPGSAIISVRQSGYAPYRKENVEVADVKDYVIVLIKCGSISGKIKAPGPIGDFLVRVYTSSTSYPDDPFAGSQTGGRFSNPDGSFIIENVPAGDYRLVVQAKGYARTVHPDPVLVKNRERTSGVEVSIVCYGANLDFVVLDEESGKPLEGARLTLSSAKQLSPNRRESTGDITEYCCTYSSADGKLWYHYLPEGEYTYSVTCKNRTIASRVKIELSEGEKKTIELTVKKKEKSERPRRPGGRLRPR